MQHNVTTGFNYTQNMIVTGTKWHKNVIRLSHFAVLLLPVPSLSTGLSPAEKDMWERFSHYYTNIHLLISQR